MPCCTFADVLALASQHEEESKCSEQESHNCGDCGQFSSCALCIGFVVPVANLFEGSCVPFIEKERSFPLFCDDVRTADISIWQPPKYS